MNNKFIFLMKGCMMVISKCMVNGKILLIIPKFFGYEDIITNSFLKRGASVDVIYENLDYLSLFYRFIYVYAKKYKKKLVDRYYRKHINDENYDYVIVIRGESLFSDTISWIREKNPNARFILYQWDSINNNPNSVKIASFFDKCLTFDFTDAVNQGWEYRPLFFGDGSNRERNRKYKLAYISSLHSQRVKILMSLKKFSIEKNIYSFLYLYSPRLIFIKNRYFCRKKEFQGVDFVNFEPLNLKETNTIYANSDIIVDYTHPLQVGLTMRTIESIGNRCRLVTNNKKVLECDFYHPNNIFVYEGDEVCIPDEFLNLEYTELNEEQYYYYSIDGWIDSVLGD